MALYPPPILAQPDITMPERLPFSPPVLNQPYDPYAPQRFNLVPVPPNFRDERYRRDFAPQPPTPPLPVAGRFGQPTYASPDLAGLLNRLYGQG